MRISTKNFRQDLMPASQDEVQKRNEKKNFEKRILTARNRHEWASTHACQARVRTINTSKNLGLDSYTNDKILRDLNVEFLHIDKNCYGQTKRGRKETISRNEKIRSHAKLHHNWAVMANEKVSQT